MRWNTWGTGAVLVSLLITAPVTAYAHGAAPETTLDSLGTGGGTERTPEEAGLLAAEAFPEQLAQVGSDAAALQKDPGVRDSRQPALTVGAVPGRGLVVANTAVGIEIPGAQAADQTEANGNALVASDNEGVVDTLAFQTAPDFVESFNVLRTQDAPGVITGSVDLAEGQSLRAGDSHSAAVVDAYRNPVVIITAPYAVDARGIDVPLILAVAGDAVRISVDHRGRDVAYPVLVDPSYYFIDGMNSVEGAWCKWPWRWSTCSKVQGHANAALAEAARLFPKSLHNGRGDAFRHCYWSARMTSDLGASEALGFGDRNEDFDGNPVLEKNMDLRNNTIGRDLAWQGRSYEADRDDCRYRAANGLLWRIVRGRLR